MKISVLIIDPQFLTRNGLFHLLDNMDLLEIEMKESVEEIEDLSKYQIIITDYLEPYLAEEKPQFKNEILANYSDKLLIISSDRDAKRIRNMISGGAKGFLTKDCQPDEILSAIEMISKGNRFYCNRVLDMLTTTNTIEPDDCQPSELSARETEVIKLIAKGFKTADIAEKLFISIHTVNSHRKNILKKLKLQSPTQLVAYAHEIGLVE